MTSGARLIEHLPLVVLALLTNVERLHRAEVTHDAGPHLASLGLTLGVGGGAALTSEVLTSQVTVHRANGEGGRNGDVRQLESSQ